LVGLFVILIFATLGFLLYWFWVYHQQAPEEEASPTSSTPSTSEIAGKFIRGQVPSGWTVVEYQNGAGTEMLTTGPTYTGLTGLEIKNPDGKIVFKLAAVHGIGGGGGCASYFKFADDSPSYYNAVLAANREIDLPDPAVVDLRTIPYQEINLFDIRGRRIGAKIYWDTDPDETYFEAACGLQERFFDFGAPQFTITDPPLTPGTSGLYQFTILDSATAEELDQLDTILNSLTTK